MSREKDITVHVIVSMLMAGIATLLNELAGSLQRRYHQDGSRGNPPYDDHDDYPFR